MKKYLFLFLFSLGFAEDINKLYSEAQALENQGNYKEAMLLYKKAASINFSKEDKYLQNLPKNDSENVEYFSKEKETFYEPGDTGFEKQIKEYLKWLKG